MFPKIMVPPNHPFVHRVFHYFHRISPSILGGFTPRIFGNIQMDDWRKYLPFSTFQPFERYGDLQGLNKAETTNKYGEEKVGG